MRICNFLLNDFRLIKFQINRIQYIQNKHVAYARERHQQNVDLAVEPQLELDLIKKQYTYFRFNF